MKDRKIFFTAFAIFLLMGAAPLHAARVHGAEEAVQQHAIGNQDGAKMELQANFGPFGSSCDTLQQNFVRLNNQTNAALAALQNGEQLSFTEKVALAMKARGMLRAARRAASNECAWLGDGSVDLQQRIGEIAAASPCASIAREMVEESSNLEGEEQEEAMREAVLVFMSPTCEVPDDDDDDDDADGDDDDTMEVAGEGDLDDALSEVNAENTQEEDDILEEIDELSDELTTAALADPTGASLLQENDGQIEVVIVGAFMALFFGLFFMLWLPFIVGAACFISGLGFLVFSLVGCLLYNVMRMLMGRVAGGCPMFNWLPHCSQAFEGTLRAIWGNNVRLHRGGYNRGYYNNGVGYNTGYVAPGVYGPGYVAPVTSGVYYDRRRRFWSGGARRQNRQVRRANRRARRANRRANRANRRARRANRRARRARRGRR